MKPTDRYLALDVLRGMTIVLMILVNTPGSWTYVYAPLKHAPWHGCTLTDLVFPFFLFVVGVSLFFSFTQDRQKPRRKMLVHIVQRALILFALGLFLNSFPQWLTDYSQLRIMGVLQRIALAYGLAALLIILLQPRRLPGAAAFILVAYWGILFFCGNSDPYSLRGNATIPFDRAILGEAHLYRGFGIPFDPEGLFSAPPAAVTVLIGYLAGAVIKDSPKNRTVIRLAGAGIALTVSGYLWGFILPINKALWTSSYVLYTAGLAALVFALLIFIIDLKDIRKWTPAFSVFGRNPLFLFIFSILWGKTLRLLIHLSDGADQTVNASAWLYAHVFVPLAGNMNGSLLFAVAHVVLFWMIGYVLYRCGIFIKI